MTDKHTKKMIPHLGIYYARICMTDVLKI